jgi:hypothetical protein
MAVLSGRELSPRRDAGISRATPVWVGGLAARLGSATDDWTRRLT